MEKKKKIIIEVGCIVLACVIFACGFFGYKAWQQKKAEERAAVEAAYKKAQIELLHTEVDKITKLDATKDHIDTKIYCEGDYGKVEESIKNYFVQMYTDVQAIYSINGDERFSILYNTDAYIQDAPAFEATSSAIATMKQEMSDRCDALSDLLSQESVASYMPEDLDVEYQDLYNEIMSANGTMEDMATIQDGLAGVKQSMNHILDKRQEMVNLLVNNQDAWRIDGTEITFNNADLLNQYNQMLADLNAM